MNDLLTMTDFHPYQDRALAHTLTHDDAMLWLDMGLGKTIISLTAIRTRLMLGQVNKVLIVAPRRVCLSVWEQEARLWAHTCDIRFSIMVGSEKQRRLALFKAADVYLINYESLEWLVSTVTHYFTKETMPFDMLVWDEVSKVKNSMSNRVKAIRPLLPMFKYRIGLTGTPMSNGLMDLHGQYLCVDGGQRLTQRITHYRDRWFIKPAFSFKYQPTERARAEIEMLISDITLQMSADEYLTLEGSVVEDVRVVLPKKLRDMYKELEKEMFLALDDVEVVALNKAALSSKCMQFCNGNVYHNPELPEYYTVHKLKLKALADIVDEADGQPILLAYNFRSDMEEIVKAYPEAVNLSGMPDDLVDETIQKWGRGEIQMLIGHPDSIGHGLNMQKGGHIVVWFGVTWRLDLYDQFNARLDRQGQRTKVKVFRIVVVDSVEDAVAEALTFKADEQDAVQKALSKYRRDHG